MRDTFFLKQNYFQVSTAPLIEHLLNRLTFFKPAFLFRIYQQMCPSNFIAQQIKSENNILKQMQL